MRSVANKEMSLITPILTIRIYAVLVGRRVLTYRARVGFLFWATRWRAPSIGRCGAGHDSSRISSHAIPSEGYVPADTSIPAISNPWNAQIDGEQPEDADRLDVDRSKPTGLMVHRHPHGHPNAARRSARHLAAPERWLQEVEEIVYQHHVTTKKTT